MVSVLWNKTSATSFTITSSQPVPFVLQGLSVAFFEAWIGVNAGRTRKRVLCFGWKAEPQNNKTGSPEVLSWQSQCNGASLFGLPSDQCASSQCVVSFCGQPVSRCNASSSNSTTSPCDVRMYLGWMGPDANNQVQKQNGFFFCCSPVILFLIEKICTSASLLPANFNLFSSGSLIAVISGQFSDFVYGVLNSASGARVSLVILMFVCLLFAQ